MLGRESYLGTFMPDRSLSQDVGSASRTGALKVGHPLLKKQWHAGEGTA